MNTWRPAQLPHDSQTLVRENLAVEYAPGLIVAADLAATPAMRSALVCPLLPRGSTPTTLTAAWIHTGWWPPSRLMRLCAAHPTSRHHTVVYRAQLENDDAFELGGFAVPTAARTAFDLLALEAPDIAVDAVIRLLRNGLTTSALLEHSQRERRRRGAPFARKMIMALDGYMKETGQQSMREAS